MHKTILCRRYIPRHISRRMSIQSIIQNKLEESFKPTHIDVINESYMHNVPEGSETHFKVVVISKLFGDRHIIERHRMINEVLKTELKNGVHALSIIAKTPEQWKESLKPTPSPKCRGGFGK